MLSAKVARRARYLTGAVTSRRPSNQQLRCRHPNLRSHHFDHGPKTRAEVDPPKRLPQNVRDLRTQIPPSRTDRQNVTGALEGFDRMDYYPPIRKCKARENLRGFLIRRVHGRSVPLPKRPKSRKFPRNRPYLRESGLCRQFRKCRPTAPRRYPPRRRRSTSVSATARPPPRSASFPPAGRLPDEGLAGRVIYVGKAKNLRSRAGSYFLKAAADERRTAELVREICDIDFIECDSEVDALLVEARLIKDIQPKFNQDLKDDKTFPYLEITIREDFPRVEFTRAAARAAARSSTARSPPPAACAARSRCCRRSSSSAPAPSTSTTATNAGAGSAPACWRASTNARPPATCGSPRKSIATTSTGCGCSSKGTRRSCSKEMRDEMTAAAADLQFEKAARLRDEIRMLETLDDRGELDTHEQPEVFYIDPKKGLAGLKKVLKLAEDAADDRRGRHRPSRRRRNGRLARAVHRRPAVQAGLQAVQDPRRRRASTTSRASTKSSPAASSGSTTKGSIFPDILLIDGGKGQLNAGLAAFAALGITPPTVISLAKQEEEIYVPGPGRAAAAEPPCLRPAAAAVRPRRSPSLRAALPPHAAPQNDVRRRVKRTTRMPGIGHGPRAERWRVGPQRRVRDATRRLARTAFATRRACRRATAIPRPFGCSPSSLRASRAGRCNAGPGRGRLPACCVAGCGICPSDIRACVPSEVSSSDNVAGGKLGRGRVRIGGRLSRVRRRPEFRLPHPPVPRRGAASASASVFVPLRRSSGFSSSLIVLGIQRSIGWVSRSAGSLVRCSPRAACRSIAAAMKPANSGWAAVGFALEFRMELHRHEPRMVGQLDDLDQRAVGAGAGEHHAVGRELLAVDVVELVAMAMPLARSASLP